MQIVKAVRRGERHWQVGHLLAAAKAERVVAVGETSVAAERSEPRLGQRALPPLGS